MAIIKIILIIQLISMKINVLFFLLAVVSYNLFAQSISEEDLSKAGLGMYSQSYVEDNLEYISDIEYGDLKGEEGVMLYNYAKDNLGHLRTDYLPGKNFFDFSYYEHDTYGELKNRHNSALLGRRFNKDYTRVLNGRKRYDISFFAYGQHTNISKNRVKKVSYIKIEKVRLVYVENGNIESEDLVKGEDWHTDDEADFENCGSCDFDKIGRRAKTRLKILKLRKKNAEHLIEIEGEVKYKTRDEGWITEKFRRYIAHINYAFSMSDKTVCSDIYETESFNSNWYDPIGDVSLLNSPLEARGLEWKVIGETNFRKLVYGDNMAFGEVQFNFTHDQNGVSTFKFYNKTQFVFRVRIERFLGTQQFSSIREQDYISNEIIVSSLDPDPGMGMPEGLFMKRISMEQDIEASTLCGCDMDDRGYYLKITDVPSNVTLTLDGSNVGAAFSYDPINQRHDYIKWLSEKPMSQPIVATLRHDVLGCELSKPFILPYEKCCKDTYLPEPGEKYFLSAWVKLGSDINVANYEDVFIQLEFIEGVKFERFKFRTVGNVVDGWQKIEGEFEVPTGAIIFKINLINDNQDLDAYFDDIRVHPFNSQMISYVYDPVTYRLVAELNNDNYATYYIYDAEGKLIKTHQETKKGIVTLGENASQLTTEEIETSEQSDTGSQDTGTN